MSPLPNYNLGSVEGEVRINYDGSGVREARSDVDRLLGGMTREEFVIRVSADIARVRSDLDQARAELQRLESLEPTIQTRVEINAARANIDQLERELRGLENERVEVEVTADTSQAERETDGLKTRLLAAGAASGIGFSSALSSALDIESATANMQAQLGVSAETAAKYGAIAGDLYANNFGASMEETNTAIASLQQNIGDLGDFTTAEITTMGEAALGLASTFGVDVSDATLAAGQLMKTGLADSATEAFDMIAAGYQGGANANGDFIDALTGSSATLAQFGLDGATSIGLIQQGLDAGAPSAEFFIGALEELAGNSGDAVETFEALGLNGVQMGIDLNSGGETAKAALQRLLDAIRGMDDPAARSTALVGLFGEEATAMSEVLLSLDPSTAASRLGTFAGTMETVNAVTGETAAAKIETARRGFETFTATLVSMDGPMGTVAAGVGAMGPEMLTAGAAILQLGFVAGPAIFGVITSLGSMAASAVATAATSTAAWIAMAAQAVARAAIIAAAWLLANPIVLIAAAIAAIVALIVMNWDSIVQFLTDTWNNIKAAAGVAWDALRAVVDQALAAIGAVIGRVVDIFTAPFRIAWALITGDAQGAWNILNDLTGGALGRMGDVISGALRNVIQFFIDCWNNIRTNASSAWQGLISSVTGFIGNLMSMVGALPGRILGALGGMATLLWNAGQDLVRGLWNGIVGMSNWLFGQIMGWIRRVVPGPILQFLGIASPSKWMRDEVGKMVPAGIAVGIEAGEDGLIKQALTMTDALSQAVTSGVDIPASLGSYVASNAATSTGLPVAAMAASAAANTSTSSSRTVMIGGLTVQVTGNLDPTDPVAWRQALEELRDGILQVERSYA